MTFIERTLHQLRTDWRHLRLYSLSYCAMAALHAASRDPGLTPIFGLFALWMMFTCAWSDSPANTNASSLSRPLGLGTVWAAQILFALLAIALPTWASEAFTWSAFHLTSSQQWAMSAGVLLNIGFYIVIGATLASVCASRRQAGIVISSGYVAIAAWRYVASKLLVFLQAHFGMEVAGVGRHTYTQQQCGEIVFEVLILFTGLVAWWWAAIAKQRRVAFALITLALCTPPFAVLYTGYDWIARTPQQYPKERIVLKTGKPDPSDKTPSHALWPTLRLSGLMPDEVPSIMSLQPVDDPSFTPFTDLPKRSFNNDAWMTYDHLHSVSAHYAPTDLWLTQWAGQVQTRPDLAKALKIGPRTSASSWNMLVAVHHMRKLGELPLRSLYASTHTYPVSPGIVLELDKVLFRSNDPYIKANFRQLTSTLIPESPHSPLRETFQRFYHVGHALFYILHDEASRENLAVEASSTNGNYQSTAYMRHTSTWVEANLRFPRSHQLLLNETEDQWIDHTTVSLWIPEERGTFDLEISAEDVRRALEK